MTAYLLDVWSLVVAFRWHLLFAGVLICLGGYLTSPPRPERAGGGTAGIGPCSTIPGGRRAFGPFPPDDNESSQ